mgnify:CR=1 FL=1
MARRRGRARIKLGKSNEFVIYVNKKDYTNYCTEWRVEKRLNEMEIAELKMYAIGSSEKEDVKRGSTIIITFDYSLVFKGIIEKTNHRSDYISEVSCYGMEEKLMKAAMNKTYTNTDTEEIIKEICSQNLDGSSPWIIRVKTNENFGKVNFKAEYDNRLSVINSLAKQIDYDWWISQSSNPFDTDYLNFSSRRGSSTPVKTLSTSGNNINVLIAGQEKDIDDMANSIYAIGGSGNNKIASEWYYATTMRGTLSGYLDTFLSEDMNDSQTYCEVYPSVLWGNILEGYWKIGDEIVKQTGGDTSYFEINRGVGGTTASSHSENDEVIYLGSSSTVGAGGIPVSMTEEIYNKLPDSGRVRIGIEEIEYTSKLVFENDYILRLKTITTDPESETTRGSNSTTPYYHSLGTEVYLVYDSVNNINYNKWNPESNTPIQKYGLREKIYTDTSITTQDDLDQLAQSLSSTTLTKRITAKACNPYDLILDISLGDEVNMEDTQSELSGNYRVVAMEFGLEAGRGIYLQYELERERIRLIKELLDTKKGIKDLAIYIQ